MTSGRWVIVVSAVLLAIYFGNAMRALLTRRGKQKYGDANARSWMKLVAMCAVVMGVLLAIGAFFHIRVVLAFVAGLTALPAVLTTFNAVTDGAKALHKKWVALRE